MQQAEIDSACELIDFLRFNVHFGRRILEEQPVSSPGVWNRMDHRPLDGFVVAITPFNFTAIAGNLPLAPALMGNTVVWKPSPTQQLAAHFTMRLLEEAGLPPGVVNLVTGDGARGERGGVAGQVLRGPALHRIHPHVQGAVADHGANLDHYRSYPRVVGETGGKDFVLAHASADPKTLVTGLVRGAFEYQGQKCSAASRAYIAKSVWEKIREPLLDVTKSLSYGDVTDFSQFGGAVIDSRAFAKHKDALLMASASTSVEVLAGGTCDDSVGYFVDPTILLGTDPHHAIFTTEFFGPILAVHVYEDADYERIMQTIESSTPYALTGAVFARDRVAVEQAHKALRFAAGNFYVNDKPTGAVVGQQPFGGSRGSGTNDKAGSIYNLQRWTSPRAIKETLVAPTDHTYPHMG